MRVDFQHVLIMPCDVRSATGLRADVILAEDTAGGQQQREARAGLFIGCHILGVDELALRLGVAGPLGVALLQPGQVDGADVLGVDIAATSIDVHARPIPVGHRLDRDVHGRSIHPPRAGTSTDHADEIERLIELVEPTADRTDGQ